MKDNNRPSSVEEYIKSRPANVQKLLQEMRRTIKAAEPQAQEKISYGMPYYSLNGRLAYFGAHENHIGFYPMASPIREFKKELAGYETSKGTVRFPFNKPLPTDLIRHMVQFRAKENLAKKK